MMEEWQQHGAKTSRMDLSKNPFYMRAASEASAAMEEVRELQDKLKRARSRRWHREREIQEAAADWFTISPRYRTKARLLAMLAKRSRT